MKSFFVPLAFEETAVTAVDAALLLAKSFGGHVLAHHVRQRYTAYPPVDFFPSSGSTQVMISESHDEATAAFARTLRSAFEERCDEAGARIVPVSEALKQNGTTGSFAEETGAMAVTYAKAARVCDLVVTVTPDPKERFMEREIFETILLESGAPVFLTPRTGLAGMPKRPLVAWDGSLQASRAVRASLPVLSNAEVVALLTIGETDEGTPSLEAARCWLERSGVNVAARTVEWPKGTIAERILNQIDATNADLLVLGGYSHSRFQESLFGGVTLHLLKHADIPMVMVH
ncbi:MAG: universal stress protein [Pseudomonadota bacterium]